METLIVHPDNKKQLAAVKAVLKALEVNFNPAELNDREKAVSLYGKEFVEKIERGEEDIKAGRVVEYTTDQLKNLCL